MDPAIIQKIVIGALPIVLAITVHEASHAYAAKRFGDSTAYVVGRMTLNPLKHIDPFLTIILPLGLALIGAPVFGGAKPVPFRPDKVMGGEWGSALVAIGGPLTNLLLAFVSYGVWALAGAPSDGTLALVCSLSVSVNLGFFLFNIIPIPPLDGSRVLYALAPDFVRRGMEFIERYGLIFVFVLVLLGQSLLTNYFTEASDFFISLFHAIFRA